MASYCPLNYTYIKIAHVSANGKVMHVSKEISSYIMDVSTCSYILINYVCTHFKKPTFTVNSYYTQIKN